MDADGHLGAPDTLPRPIRVTVLVRPFLQLPLRVGFHCVTAGLTGTSIYKFNMHEWEDYKEVTTYYLIGTLYNFN